MDRLMDVGAMSVSRLLQLASSTCTRLLLILLSICSFRICLFSIDDSGRPVLVFSDN